MQIYWQFADYEIRSGGLFPSDCEKCPSSPVKMKYNRWQSNRFVFPAVE